MLVRKKKQVDLLFLAEYSEFKQGCIFLKSLNCWYYLITELEETFWINPRTKISVTEYCEASLRNTWTQQVEGFTLLRCWRTQHYQAVIASSSISRFSEALIKILLVFLSLSSSLFRIINFFKIETQKAKYFWKKRWLPSTDKQWTQSMGVRTVFFLRQCLFT